MTWLSDLMRPALQKLKPYTNARKEANGFVPDIAIDGNEFPWPPFGTKLPLNRYPDPQPENLLGKIAALWNLHKDTILISRGADEGIDLLIRLFCREGIDQIVICPPTYGVYKVAAEIQGAEVLKVPLTSGHQLDVEGILNVCTPNTKLVFIPSPNAPMGHFMRREDIFRLCEARAEKSLIVIDETYVEFAPEPSGLLPDLTEYPNLVVLRTLSKAHALAGERIGFVIGQPELIQNLLKIHASYPLTQTSIRAALDALSPCGLILGKERRKIIVNERKRMAELLPKSSLIDSVFPSETNFLLAKTKDSAEVMRKLQSFGILARNRDSEIPGAVRFSIGTPEENALVLKALDIAVEDASPPLRLFSARRQTKETSIGVTVNLDDPGFLRIDTGIGFFDHMLEQVAIHGGFGLGLDCKGDLKVDMHHSIEDCGLALGEALKGALGDKRGIGRYGFTTALDEALAQATIDLSGRPYSVFDGKLPTPLCGQFPCEMTEHFFQSFAVALGASIHIAMQGDNSHHMVEAAFKAVGRALRQAFKREGTALPSSKGVL
ncbi:MAG: histidinol-phosphate transaminase [Alphaproteobacteria bacterium]|nr:histidinol-phosphate transaminase [Alphaproteobacteria bacterium]